MNETAKQLLADYRAADFHHRLNIYLQTPELRSEFIKIDQAELKKSLASTSPAPKFSLVKKLSNFSNTVALGLRKYIGSGSL